MNKVIYYCEKEDKYTFFTLDEIKAYEIFVKSSLRKKLTLLISICKKVNGLSYEKLNLNIKKIIALKILSEITQEKDLKTFYFFRHLEELNKCKNDKFSSNKENN